MRTPLAPLQQAMLVRASHLQVRLPACNPQPCCFPSVLKAHLCSNNQDSIEQGAGCAGDKVDRFVGGTAAVDPEAGGDMEPSWVSSATQVGHFGKAAPECKVVVSVLRCNAHRPEKWLCPCSTGLTFLTLQVACAQPC